jgi:hypothetical protein
MLRRNPADELEEMRLLGADFFPTPPARRPPFPDNYDDEEARLRELQVRKHHARAHAWEPPTHATDTGTGTGHPAAAPKSSDKVEATAGPSEAVKPEVKEGSTSDRIPRENDAVGLMQTLAIKDAALRQMEAALLTPLPEQALLTVGLSRRAAALVANARRREAVLALKLRALTREVEEFRKREKAAVAINAGLRKRLCDTLTDLDAISLRREVRELRADLRAALGREAALQRELMSASNHIAKSNATLERNAAAERRMQADLDYVRGIAVHAMSARAADALGAGPDWGTRRPPPDARVQY